MFWVIEFSCSNNFHDNSYKFKHQCMLLQPCGTVIGCFLCNKSIKEISSVLNIPWSNISGVITM